ncbi:unnamed protein product [Closterium sp. NIES-64]|nr:unnamed protein product [Closterium sp. NIES-64]
MTTERSRVQFRLWAGQPCQLHATCIPSSSSSSSSSSASPLLSFSFPPPCPSHLPHRPSFGNEASSTGRTDVPPLALSSPLLSFPPLSSSFLSSPFPSSNLQGSSGYQRAQLAATQQALSGGPHVPRQQRNAGSNSPSPTLALPTSSQLPHSYSFYPTFSSLPLSSSPPPPLSSPPPLGDLLLEVTRTFHLHASSTTRHLGRTCQVAAVDWLRGSDRKNMKEREVIEKNKLWEEQVGGEGRVRGEGVV